MTARIELDEMRFYAYHGVDPQETKVGNRFTVQVGLTLPVPPAVETDCLEDTIDYAAVYRRVKQEMDRPSKLIEHVAGRILYGLKNDFPGLTGLVVRVSKQTPPFGGDVRCASVTLAETWD